MARNKTSGRIKLGIISSIILVINVLLIFALALSYLSVHISPLKSWLLPFFGLFYPYLLLVNILLIIYWILVRRWLFLLSIICIAAGWNHLERTLQIRVSQTLSSDLKAFKVFSYNVKNLSNDNVILFLPEIRDKIIGYLDDEDPDILCLQEFAIINHPAPEAFIDSVSTRLNMPFHAHSQYVDKMQKKIDAIIIFSKFPIINFSPIKKDSTNSYGIYADLLFENDTVRLFNIHLESIRLMHKDYNFITELDLQFEENEKIKENSIRIFKKLRTAFALRASQVDQLTSDIRNSPYPVILCGDFNDTPNSYAYQQLTENLTDAFMESGIGFGNTYIGKLPSYRIDFILYSDFFTSWNYNRDLVKYSDHYPISCLIGVRQEE